MKAELRKTLGFFSCFSVAVGLVVASSTLVSLGQGMGLAGGGFIIAMAAAWVLQLFSAQSYAELSCMMPHAGGIRSYTKVSMGSLPAMAAVILAYIIPNLFAAPAELAVAGTVIKETFVPGIPSIVCGGLLLALLTITNVIGVDVFAKLQIAFTLTMMISMALLGIIGLTGIGARPAPDLPNMPFNPMGIGVLGLTALAIWLYIGIEFVTPMAQEARQAEKNIPRAMFYGLLAIFCVNLVYGYASLKYVPAEQLANSNHPHVDMALAMLGKPGMIWIAIVSVFASASTINTVIGVVPRMLYGMAVSRELPAVFRSIHPRFHTPWIGILFMAGCISLFFFGGIYKAPNLIVYILAACCSWLFAYIIAHLDVIILRRRYPHFKRPYKAPFYPIPQIIGALGMGYAIVNIAPVPEMESTIFRLVGIMVAGTFVYVIFWLRFIAKEPMFRPMPMQDAQEEWGLVEKELYPNGIPATFVINPGCIPNCGSDINPVAAVSTDK
ncbi:amino acid permease-associated region [Solidesulfovibrio fructosivorans JJ]]|uniref:Amino acid permease-associated region n=1 Tax=Solidesulfovibrio fructosivorans JJ] TaxID=596151 RepID=E1JSU3_SOLFR|nr:APC family permease [Solidesulfovibrio fructosivorans]EFL52576.1 amino acid permease-associated region [Solidesulfovibrio fructosivorans JJ]]